MSRETRLLHLADDPPAWDGAVNPPVVHASLFCFEDLQQYLDTVDGKVEHLTYGRMQNPTKRVLERKVAFLEKSEDALALASGMAAITTALLALLQSGDHLLVVSCVYGPVRAFCDAALRKLGIETEYFPSGDAVNLSGRVGPNTRVVYLESPGSLTFDIQDLRGAARVARQHGIVTVIDNTWASPLFQCPADFGIDLIVHSGTKYIGGHSDLMLGLVAGPTDLMTRVRGIARFLGGTTSPDDAYLAVRGLRTLAVRMERHQSSALRVARWLEKRREVREVLHPGLESFAGHELAESQMTGHSGLFSFRLQRRDRLAQHRFVDSLLGLFRLGYSWGGYESLIMPLITHHRANPALRAQLGLDDDTYRISIGLEDPEDIITCLEEALIAWARG